MKVSRLVFFTSLALLGQAVLAGESAVDPISERIAGNDPIMHWNFPDASLQSEGEVWDTAGPPQRTYPLVGENEKAALFDGNSYLRAPDSGSDPKFQFTNGETLTIEAWLRSDKISDGQIQYLVGKGRTHRDGYDPDNQNWSLRLHAVKGQARLSFLFRSADQDEAPGAYHRWTSKRGFPTGQRWHHVALSYTFGDPESLRAWIDGSPTDGSWDKNGATTRPPVVDDDEVWIGSAQGGSRGSSFRGAIAHLALYRHEVEGLADAYEIKRALRPPDLAKADRGKVLVEIFRADAGRKEWPLLLDDPLRTLDAEGFALFQLPPTYGPQAERLEQKGVYFVRLAADTDLPAGSFELLLRAPGLARLIFEGDVIATLGPAPIVRDAHGPLRERPRLPYPRPRLGTNETFITVNFGDGEFTMMLEALVGDPGGKIQIGELLVALRPLESDRWQILAADPAASLPFTRPAVERYRSREQRNHQEHNTELRRRLLDNSAGYWHGRHDSAREYISSLTPVAVPGNDAPTAVDRFLTAKIKTVAGNQTTSDSHFSRVVRPLLEEHCFRCHGKKSKGGLRLTSRKAALKGGDSGPALVEGKAHESELLARVTSDDKDLRMPPKGDPLTADQVAALEQWIEDGAQWDEAVEAVTIPAELDELTFLRRIYLDTVGVFPTPSEIERYRSSNDPRKREKLIDDLLADPRHADHWVSYWQDVLAENPRLVKPTLNNTGPFRWWIHESLLDNKPFDRFVTELVTFAGGTYSGAAGGFRLATQNDAPMAAKAHVLGTAFLGLEMRCARCHDAPFHSLRQEDLFSLAAMLEGAPLKVPSTSTVPKAFFEELDARQPRIQVTLDPNTAVPPAWPFPELAPEPDGGKFKSSREELAYQITRPDNQRFARVIVNRVWKRYFGQGFVEPAGDWEVAEPSHPALLDYLARAFVSNNYDLRHLSRLILNSEAYRRAPRIAPAPSSGSRFFEAPLQRRLSAEQLVDSLFAATGTPLFAEELTLDVEGWYPNKNFLNMGRPKRAWEFVSLSTERDRPSLTLPLAQAVVSFMEAYGWRANRAEPITERPLEPDVLQAGMVANSLLATWWSRLSDYSELTKLAVTASTPEDLVERLYLRLLTRQPSSEERRAFIALLTPGFDTRLTEPGRAFTEKPYVRITRDISWRNHLNAEANQLAAEIEESAAAGPPPTDLLAPAWRERMEDAIWALLNSPEIQFTP